MFGEFSEQLIPSCREWSLKGVCSFHYIMSRLAFDVETQQFQGVARLALDYLRFGMTPAPQTAAAIRRALNAPSSVAHTETHSLETKCKGFGIASSPMISDLYSLVLQSSTFSLLM